MFAMVPSPPPIVQKRNVLIFMAALTLICGWGLQNKYVLALGEIYTVILTLAWWSARGMFDTANAAREHYPRAFEGSRVDAVLRTRTRRKRPVYLLEILDHFPPAADERVRHLVRSPFDARRHYEIHYEKMCVRRRGPYVIGPVTLRAADPLGLFLQTRTLPVLTDLLVYPQARELPVLSVLGEGTLFHVGQETTARAGHSEEFVRLRDYRSGDSPLHIHWPSSARHGRFIVKEFQETVVTELTLIVDLTRLSQTGIGDQTSTELIVRVAASIAARAIELSHLVEMYVVGAAIDHVTLGGGGRHLTSLLDRLALCRAEGRGLFSDRLPELTVDVRRGATVAIVSGAASLNLETLESVVRQLLLSGARVILALIDERGFIKLTREQDVVHAAAEPFDRIVLQLRLAGADVVPIRHGENMQQCFAR